MDAGHVLAFRRDEHSAGGVRMRRNRGVEILDSLPLHDEPVPAHTQGASPPVDSVEERAGDVNGRGHIRS